MIIKGKATIEFDVEIEVEDNSYLFKDEYYGYELTNEDRIYELLEEKAKSEVNFRYNELEIDDELNFEIDYSNLFR